MTRFPRCRIWCCVTAIILGWGAPYSLAQTANTGAIAGNVTDPSHLLVPGAKVTVTNEATGAVVTVVSRGDGGYTAPLLLPGLYGVEVSATGFNVAQYRHIEVNVSETEALNVRLSVGSQQQTVEVSAGADVLQTETSSLGRVTDGEMLQNIPLAEGNFTQIVDLNPNVANEVTTASTLGRGDGGMGQIVANGTRASDSNFSMDGADSNDRMESGLDSGGVAIPNQYSIQELKVQTGLYDATYGPSAGANVNVVTKGGSNQFHGNIWEYFRNTVLNANDFFLKRSGAARGVFNQNQYGIALSGPIKRDRVLFFASYQGTGQKNGLDPDCESTINGLTGLTDTNRTAAGLGAAFAGKNGAAGTQAADTIQANGSNIAPQAIALLNIKEANGQFLIPSEQGTVTFSQSCSYSENQFVADVDYIQSSKSQFNERFFFTNSSMIQTLPLVASQNDVPGVPLTVNQDFRNFSLTHTYTFSPNLLNQAEIGFHRTYTYAPSTSAFSYSSIGATVPSFDNNYPTLRVTGDFTVPGAPASAITFVIASNTFDAQDLLSYSKGKHFLRFGGAATRFQINRNIPFGASLTFSSFPDFLLGLPAGPSGNGGSLSNVSSSHDYAGPSIFNAGLRAQDADAFVQDDFKVTSRLTLNLGFRYDLIGAAGDHLGHNVGFNPSLITPYSTPPITGSLVGFEVSSNFPGTVPAGVTQLKNTFGYYGNGQNTWNPRTGFSWQFLDRVVLRGGYGIYHSVLTGNPQLLSALGQPFVLSRSYSGLTNASASWAQPFQPFTGTIPSYSPYTPTTLLSVSSPDPNYRPGFVQEFSLGTQTKLFNNMVLEIGYAGAKGTHTLNSHSFNQACVVGAPVDGCPAGFAITTNTTQNIDSRVPYLGFSPTGVTLRQSEGAYWYNALESSLTKRFSQGLQFQVSYTFSKELDTYANTASGKGGNDSGGATIGDANHPLYGPDSFIRPQRLVASYVYHLPSVASNSMLLKGALNGWQLSGETTIQAGHFLTIQVSSPYNIYGNTSPTPTLASGCLISQLVTRGPVTSKLFNYFNSSCVAYDPVSPYASPQAPLSGGACGAAATCPQATGFGNMGVGIVRGPDQADWDMSLGKQFGIRWPKHEGANLGFRTDFFNAFNHPQFSDPTTSVPAAGTPTSSNTFGYITSSAVNPRVIQMSLVVKF